MAFTVQNRTGEVKLTPVNNVLRLTTVQRRPDLSITLTAEDARTLGSALLAFAEKHDA